MSLVREALAKAEREAAARAARERGLPAALADAAQPFRARRHRKWPWMLGLAAAALAGAAATALLSGAWRRAPAPAPPAAPPPAAAPTAPVATAPAPPQASAAPPPLEPSAAATASPAPAVLPPAAPAPGRPARHVRELALAGGRSIRLGGIAWSASAPLAYLNDRLVGVGENVEGHRVTRIDRDRVTLDDGARRIVLTLR